MDNTHINGYHGISDDRLTYLLSNEHTYMQIFNSYIDWKKIKSALNTLGSVPHLVSEHNSVKL